MKHRILQGNVFDVLPTLAPGSVDCCVTSPPYWMLRSYLAKDHPLKPLELGSEKTPAEYVENMVRVFELVKRALADHGTCSVNVGDTYSQYNANRGNSRGTLEGRRNLAQAESDRGLMAGIDAGNLCLIPWRLAIALQDAGWIVRSVVVWHKPAPMPSSVSGWAWRRCRVKVSKKRQPSQASKMNHSGGSASHRDCIGGEWQGATEWSDCPGCQKCEPTNGYVLRRGSWRPTSSWEPILMLAKSGRYFCDGEPVKTPAAEATISRMEQAIDEQEGSWRANGLAKTNGPMKAVGDGATANLRDVWTIASEPLREKHYAAYPTQLVERCLRAGTSARGYCPTCGKPWVRMVDQVFVPQPDVKNWNCVTAAGRKGLDESNNHGDRRQGTNSTTTLGWRPSCTCPEQEPRPGLVLDPFAGSGRTGTTSQRLGLDFVGIDLNPDYVAMAERRLRENCPLFV